MMMSNMKLIATLMFGACLVASQVSCRKEVDGINQEQAKELEKEYLAAQKSSESKWLSYGDKVHVYLYRGGGEPNENVAAYGVQQTIVQTRTGGAFPQSAKDWQLVNGIKQELEQATRPTRVGHNARLVMFDNQYGVKLGHVSLELVKERTEAFLNELNIPCTVFISVNKDRFRKPHTGMFHLFEQAFNGGQKVDLSKSYYKGFASGGDRYSDHDRKFAANLNIEFREA